MLPGDQEGVRLALDQTLLSELPCYKRSVQQVQGSIELSEPRGAAARHWPAQPGLAPLSRGEAPLRAAAPSQPLPAPQFLVDSGWV